MDNKEIGMRIKEKRKLLKLTQKELATKIGKKEITIRKYESGEITIPRDVIDKISEILNTSPFDLLYDVQTLSKGVSEWEGLESLLLSHGYLINISCSPEGEPTYLTINEVDFKNEEIEDFKNQIFQYIDFLISKQSNKNQGK